ncbi:MAG: hypothetical protein K0Q97_1506 [Bacillota bacterium]|nr:hypothetical protein [Bacillota bacterium]
MKKIIFTLSLCMMLVFSSVQAFAEEIIVNIDSEQVEFNEQSGKPFVDTNWRTQVPFRQTLEKYGATVEWNQEKQIAIATKDGITVEIPIGTNYIIKNGEKLVNDTTSLIVNNRTYLPIRKVIEAFGSEVQWDDSVNTVVITKEPFDVKAILLKANEKSYAWENYDGKILIDILMPMPDGLGNVQNMKMKMDMDATIFVDPMKMKMSAIMDADFMGEKISQPIMEMYLTADDTTFTTYMGMYDFSGLLTWQKSIMEDESFASLFKLSKDSSAQMDEKYIKDVKYFGKYKDTAGNTLLKIQYAMSGEIYNEVLGTYLQELSQSTNESDIMAAEMLKNIGDIQLISYIDEKSGELVKYEFDLSKIYSSMFGSLLGMDGMEGMTAEDLAVFQNMQAKMVMEIHHINAATDFVIPKEALNAPEIDLMEPVETEVQ